MIKYNEYVGPFNHPLDHIRAALNTAIRDLDFEDRYGEDTLDLKVRSIQRFLEELQKVIGE